ncbi:MULTISPECIES: class I SAM-dependent methyltransferase [Streptomyces]|uniref:Class I SAM-dependent methyltransferase n=1 Tax=Streptomyces cadmiisoli TaxID=2184053 RepID=A0A2Z4J4M8_9ACTN|nr:MULTISPECIES: class I SAM-dependent methyltransferase [Streptomyces]AWW39957.1 class I SAM-dependent methyltransferase [Streptomyces cadmiisoli]
MSASPVPSDLPSADRRRAARHAEQALGTDRFHEPRRTDCPWCGSARLRTRLTARDLLQHKPGTFTLDVCRDCGHTFQNPRLTREGLAFYLRDLDGHRPDGARQHRSAARAMLPHPEPESWLDIGTGRGEFPATAGELFPYTSFDGLDPTPLVLGAQADGHVEEAYRGRLTDPELRTALRGRYDVVSMLHHLEHTPDPREELRAALAALRPGGRLLVETADPTCAFAALLGGWWARHGQPRHLHLLPLSNVRAELESQGCAVDTADRHGAHVPHDLSAATSLALGRILPDPDAPGRRTAPGALRRGARTVLTGAAAPVRLTATALDHALAPLLCRAGFSNTYRIIARKGAAPPEE